MLLSQSFQFMAVVVILALQGCRVERRAVVTTGTAKTNSSVYTCSVAQDQTGTFAGRWNASPIPVGFYQDSVSATVGPSEFDDSEKADRIAMISTWSQYFGVKGVQIFSVADQGPPIPERRFGDGTCPPALFENEKFVGRVGMQKASANVSSDYEGVIASTQRCTHMEAGKRYPTLHTAQIIFNYQYFAARPGDGSGKKAPDWKTITLHELGHVLGLNHSCESMIGNPTVANCDQAPSSYRFALMFPYLMNGPAAVVRQNVDDNTAARVSCLYAL